MMPVIDPEEQELLESVERGEWPPVSNVAEEIKRYQSYAAATLAMTSVAGALAGKFLTAFITRKQFFDIDATLEA